MRSAKALTLVEVVVVVAILAILFGIIFSVTAPAREAARQTHCISNLRQLYVAWSLYTADWPGHTFPNTQMAHVPGLQSLDPFLKNRSILVCPDTPAWEREMPRVTYILRFMDNVWEGRPNPGTTQFLEELEKKGHETVASRCLEHDAHYYQPRMSDVAATFRPTFQIQLLFDGSVRKGRLGHAEKPH